ncbi:GNAT family N-acetyltransferase [Chamaesiphon polymorphus]|uniref:N-acetyltransferase domain-containing protein n=1 Tax=Chamaesiphon polymorphus CCALA 037 TaxID=2107692 RepID=A0A2T1FYA0_9CYAN|nr:GNAT family N-acetyltransferase [Chamaesiphon polymorphus]PSB49977.1 hypothetical protein C7B77_23320 [Chamaesiphon polymorphus CCALA 037]
MDSILFETNRTIVRKWTSSDIIAYYLLRSDPLVMKFIGEPLRDKRQAEKFLISRTIADYSKYGYGRYAVVLKASGDVIGNTGLLYLRELDRNDLAISLLPQYWGLGYGTEILEKCVQYAFEELALPELIGLVDPLNIVSSKLLMKIGMIYSEKITYHDEACNLYTLKQQDWSNKTLSRTIEELS